MPSSCSIIINGEEYVPAKTLVGDVKMVRTKSAGVFCGIILERPEPSRVIMAHARRIWFWKGAASLSELATRGTSRPKECRFPAPVTRVELLEVIEILDVTKQAEESINEVPVWTA